MEQNQNPQYAKMITKRTEVNTATSCGSYRQITGKKGVIRMYDIEEDRIEVLYEAEGGVIQGSITFDTSNPAEYKSVTRPEVKFNSIKMEFGKAIQIVDKFLYDPDFPFVIDYDGKFESEVFEPVIAKILKNEIRPYESDVNEYTIGINGEFIFSSGETIRWGYRDLEAQATAEAVDKEADELQVEVISS